MWTINKRCEGGFLKVKKLVVFTILILTMCIVRINITKSGVLISNKIDQTGYYIEFKH